MQPWNNIVQAAMLGTDKKQLGPQDVTGDIAKLMEPVINNPVTDREEKFLQTASLLFNYRRCGSMPLFKEGVNLAIADAEVYPRCNAAAINVLNDIISEDSISLLTIWLQRCESNQQVVPPLLIPVLFSKAEKNIALQNLVEKCCGKRGAWLAQFNLNWVFSSAISPEELWQTGTPDQRKQVLQQLRISDPVTARDWLQKTWLQESVNTKITLLKVLSETADENDIEWLENVALEKNQKVKEAAQNILKRLPASSIVQKYWTVLQETVVLKKQKALLGLTTKTSLQIELPAVIDDAIFTTGIEKVSNQKEITDDDFIILQLIQSVPPAAWELHFNAGPEAVINYFQQQESTKKFIPALVIAISRFHDKRWAFAFMQHGNTFYIDIIPLLPLQQQEFYSNKFFLGYENSLINSATERTAEWGVELTKNIFRHAANNPYQFNRTFYNKHIHLIPVQIVHELEKCTPTETYNQSVWSNTSEYIIKLIMLKIQTIKAFSKND